MDYTKYYYLLYTLNYRHYKSYYECCWCFKGSNTHHSKRGQTESAAACEESDAAINEGDQTVAASNEGDQTVAASNEGDQTVAASNEGDQTVAASNEGDQNNSAIQTGKADHTFTHCFHHGITRKWVSSYIT